MNKRLKKKRGIYTKFKDKETWSLDYTIAQFILPRLIRYKKLNNGVPGIFFIDEEGNDHIMDTDNYTEIASKKWNDTLDKMIWSFDEIVTEKNEPMFHSDMDEEEKKKWLSDLQIYSDKIQEGLDLFAKYFRDLWW